MDILNKVKDKTLKEMLEKYKSLNVEFGLIDIMNYFGAKFRIDAFEAIFPKFEVEGITNDMVRINLGGFIIHSTLYIVYLIIKDSEVSLHISEQSQIVITRENIQKGGSRGN